MENEQKYWFMIEPYVYIHLTENQVILYNTLDYASIESSRMEVVGLMRELLREENVGVVSLDASYMERSVPIKSFVEEIREKFMGDIVDQALSNRKPVQILPFINYPVWEEKGCDLNFLEDWSQILSEVTVHIDQTVNMDLLVNYLRTIPGNVAFILKADWRENLNIDLLLESLKDRSVPITIDSSYQCIPVIERTYASDFIYRVSVAFPIDHSAWEAVVRKEQALGHSFNYFFKITSEADYQVAEQLIETYPIGNYQLDPVYTGQNLDFSKKNVVGLAQSSIWIYSIPLKHIVTAAHYNGKIPRNPFAMYHVDPDHKEREFLTLDELTAMTDIKLEDPNMAFARDLFIFGCWTGISFIDIKNLTEDNISMVNSAPWIVSKRQKTGVPFQIKLMDIPMQIVERYKSFRKGNHLFNIGNLDGINKRIKKVAVMCGIKKRVSFHVSRHSWAVLALEYGMPIESVSKILGHTNITTTQIYAKVTSTKLDHDIAVFESRIKGHLPVMGGMA